MSTTIGTLSSSGLPHEHVDQRGVRGRLEVFQLADRRTDYAAEVKLDRLNPQTQ